MSDSAQAQPLRHCLTAIQTLRRQVGWEPKAEANTSTINLCFTQCFKQPSERAQKWKETIESSTIFKNFEKLNSPCSLTLAPPQKTAKCYQTAYKMQKLTYQVKFLLEKSVFEPKAR